ncbi:MAG: hypothetical protein QF879_05580 [Candidatus Latescibacteria bacterium]|nr:hypothetical protein [Candidatus Latescibacterota bacterium]
MSPARCPAVEDWSVVSPRFVVQSEEDIVGREALEFGAADFLIKPIDLGQVQTHLDVYGVLQSDLFSSSSSRFSHKKL